MIKTKMRMVCCSLFLILCTISIIYLVKRVSTLHMEAVRGGILADQENFKYQAAIIGKENYTTSYNLICGGAIVSNYYVLTAAQCFTNGSGHLKHLRFSVAVGTINLKLPNVLRIEINFILTRYPGYPSYLNDIAMVQLAQSLHLENNQYLSKVELPHAGESFTGTGFVAGFGYTWIQTGIDPSTGRQRRIHGGTDYILRYAVVEILNDTLARQNYRDIFPDSQICAKMLTIPSEQIWGLCSKDTGTPLVIDNKVVGVASINPINCDDTVYGGLYTKVSAHAFFYESILEGLPAFGTLIYRNRRYFREQQT